MVLSLLTVAVFTSLASCASQPVKEVPRDLTREESIEVGGLRRTFRYYQAPTAGKLQPMVLLFHGNGGSSRQVLGLNGKTAPNKIWLEIANRERLTIVVPEGTDEGVDERGWNDCRADAPTNPKVDDVAFVSALIDRFVKEKGVDAKRVFAAGLSNGGHMAMRLAIELADKVTAVGVVAATLPAKTQCSAPTAKKSVLFMNGTKDPILPFAGGTIGKPSSGRGTALSADKAIQFWLRANQQSSQNRSSRMPDWDPLDTTTVTKKIYGENDRGIQIAFYEIEGGGHTEPSIRERYSQLFEFIVGKQSHDIEMAEEMWRFFKPKSL